MMRIFPGFIFLLLFTFKNTIAQVPKMGNDTLLDIACWNTEWFGDATSGNGPSDETLQFNNVKSVLLGADIDVWGLAEISDPTAWANLTAALPAYGNTIATFSQTQKTALLYKKDMFDILSSAMVLNDGSCSACYYDFASGRYPLEVVLRRKSATHADTLYFYVMHLKAYADQASFDRRKAAAVHLKTYLDANRAGKKVIVLGDWNDELKGSTVSGNPSPFDNLQNDSAHYFFISRQLSDMGKKSYAFSSGKMIDHIMLTTAMKEFYVPASSKVLDMLPTYVSGYSSNTSDHYPVMGFFNMTRYPGVGVKEQAGKSIAVVAYPNPVRDELVVETNVKVKEVILANAIGQTQETAWSVSAEGKVTVRISPALNNGFYFLTLHSADGVGTVKVMLQR